MVRHGESEGNCDKNVNRHTPNHKVCLTSQGHEQAKQAGNVLREFLSKLNDDEYGSSDMSDDPSLPDAHSHVNPRSVYFYTSPYQRARQTCVDIIEGIKDIPGVEYTVSEEARMREQDFGNFQSAPEETAKIWEQRAHYGHFFYRIPHGESAADVYDRVTSFNESLYRKFERDSFPNVLVLVTHGIWARVFLMKWFRWSYEEFESLRNIPHCQFLVMKRSQEGRYLLKTPLRKWDDLPDSDVEEEVDKEFRQEVEFNSKTKVDIEDLDIDSILRAQKDAIKENRKKDRELKQVYLQSMNKYLKCHQSPSVSSVDDLSMVTNGQN